MRTRQQDQGGTVTFGAAVADAASGGGVAQPGGIPFTFTRTGAGTYSYKVDPRLMVLAAQATHGGGGGAIGTQASSLGAGSFTVVIYTSAGAGASVPHSFLATARDGRT